VAEGDSNFKPERPWLSGRSRKDGPSQPALSNPHLVLLINYSQVYPVRCTKIYAVHRTFTVHFHPFSLGRVDSDLKHVFLLSEARR
jgi:hypothetical protein